MEKRKPGTARRRASKAGGKLKTHAGLSSNYLIDGLQPPKNLIEPNGQMLLDFGQSRTGESMVYMTQRDAETLTEHTGASISDLFYKVGGQEVQALFYAILDLLHDTHYKEATLSLDFSTLRELTGQESTDTYRIKRAYMRAAWWLYATSFRFKIGKMTRTAHLIRFVDEYRGGMQLTIEEALLPILASEIPKVVHDTSLFKADKSMQGAVFIGLKLEDISRRHKEAETVTCTVDALLHDIPWMPEYLTEQRNYSKRIEWLEARLNHLAAIGFLAKPPTWTGRPHSIQDEKACKLQCTFGIPHKMPKAITSEKSPQKTAKKCPQTKA